MPIKNANIVHDESLSIAKFQPHDGSRSFEPLKFELRNCPH
jgi:hypothetical protein